MAFVRSIYVICQTDGTSGKFLTLVFVIKIDLHIKIIFRTVYEGCDNAFVFVKVNDALRLACITVNVR